MEEVLIKGEENDNNIVVLSGVPLFLHKLWNLVCETDTDSIICWNSTGNAFIIKDQFKLSRDVLPVYFKHNNLTSFIRQLNLYGFHKLPNLLETQFYHPYFRSSNPELLSLIKRKLPVARTNVDNTVNSHQFEKVLEDVHKIKDKQENVNTQLAELHEENSALWYELCTLRARHNQQTKLVNKLVHVLVNFLKNQTRSCEGGGSGRATIVEVGNDTIFNNTPSQKMILNDTKRVNKPKYPIISFVDPESRKRKLIEFLNEEDKNSQSSEILLNNLENIKSKPIATKNNKKIILNNNKTTQPLKLQNKSVITVKQAENEPQTKSVHQTHVEKVLQSQPQNHQDNIANSILSDPILSTFIKPNQESIPNNSTVLEENETPLVANNLDDQNLTKNPTDTSDLDAILNFLVEPATTSNNTEELNPHALKNNDSNPNLLEGVSNSVPDNLNNLEIDNTNNKITTQFLGNHVDNVQLDLDNLQSYLNDIDFNHLDIMDLFNDGSLDAPPTEESGTLKSSEPEVK